MSPTDGSISDDNSGKLYISICKLYHMLCHSELGGGIIGGVVSAALATILVIVLLSALIAIKCYNSRNQ